MKVKSTKVEVSTTMNKQMEELNLFLKQHIQSDSILLSDTGLRHAKQNLKMLHFAIFMTEIEQLERDLERKKITPNEKRKKLASLKKT